MRSHAAPALAVEWASVSQPMDADRPTVVFTSLMFLEAMMKQWVFAGALIGALALAGPALALESQAALQPATPAAHKTKPAGSQAPEQRVPKSQPNTAADPAVGDTAQTLGTVRLTREVKADGKALPAGSYQVRLTTDEASPDAVGTSGKLERWVEFLQRGTVKGREVATIVPGNEIHLVEKDTPPKAGGSKVELLKGGDYVRVWINKAGTHYLIHLVAG